MRRVKASTDIRRSSVVNAGNSALVDFESGVHKHFKKWSDSVDEGTAGVQASQPSPVDSVAAGRWIGAIRVTVSSKLTRYVTSGCALRLFHLLEMMGVSPIPESHVASFSAKGE